MARERHLHTSHWGAFEAEVEGGAVVAVHPYPDDPDPSPLLGNIAGEPPPPGADRRSPWCAPAGSTTARGRTRRRGGEPFVPVSWPTAIDLLARELRRVYDEHGGEAVYGGSYGWASAGRFHHAQSQLHRFLNCLGGYVRGEHSYSNGALTVIMPHVVGDMRGYLDRATAWSVIERHTELLRLLRRHPAQEHDGQPRAGRAATRCATTSAR